MLDALREHGGILLYACKASGVSRSALQEWRKDDPQFRVECEAAIEEGTDVLENAVRVRAIDGVAKPVYQQGQLVGHVQEYSDTLAMFLLKGHRSEVFRDRVQSDVNMNANVNAKVTVEDVGSKLLAKLDALADRRGADGADQLADD